MIIPLNNGITTSILDRDAREFIRVAGVTDETQIRAVNELCKDLKREGFWTGLFRCYPFVYAGTTASMLVCLKSRIALSLNSSPGSITFSNTGVEFGFTSSLLADTLNLNGVEFPVQGNFPHGGHLSIYNRKPSASLTQSMHHGHNGNWGFGPEGAPSNRYRAMSLGFLNLTQTEYNSGITKISGSLFSAQNNEPGQQIFTYSGNSTGLFIYSTDRIYPFSASNTNPWTFYLSRNGVRVGITYSSTFNHATQQFNQNLPNLGNHLNLSTNPNGRSKQSQQEICWWSYGFGNSSTIKGGPILLSEQEKFYQIVQKFQTALGRQV